MHLDSGDAAGHSSAAWRDPEAFRLHAELCKALTDPKRLMILHELREGERSVGELAEAIGMSLNNASRHLTLMRYTGLVASRREGSTVYYSLIEPRILAACDTVHQIAVERLAWRGPRTARAAGDAASAPDEGPLRDGPLAALIMAGDPTP